MSEWKECKLSDVIEIIGGGTPKTTVKEYWNGDIPWLSVTDFNNGRKYCFDAEKKIKEKGLKESSTKILKKGQVIISARGTVGVISMLGRDMAFNQSNYGIVAKPELTENNFIYYLLKYNIPNFLSNSYGAVFDTITKETFQQIDILLPTLPEQNAIACVLSSLDDKIDLLHRQNKTLEALAETLFRQWFVEEADESWERIKITDLFEIRDGTHESPKQKEFGKKLLTSMHILKNKLDFENSYFISEEEFDNVNKRSKVDQFDIPFSMIGTIGLTYFEQSEIINYAIKNIGLLKISQNPQWAYFTYLWLNSTLGNEFVHEFRRGSTQEYISLGSLRDIVFSINPQIKICDFNILVKPLFDRIFLNQKHFCTLEKLRDTLLPKLMSGELRVKIN